MSSLRTGRRSVAILFVLAFAERAAAECSDVNLQAQMARESFVRITAEGSAISGHAEPKYGSGVLLTQSGYVLTAGHVVADMVDRGSDGLQVRTAPGSRVVVEFLDDQERPDGNRLVADVVGYFDAKNQPPPPAASHADVALLRLRELPDDIGGRSPPLIDEDLGSADCENGDCLRLLGFPTIDQPLEDVSGRPVQNTLPGSLREVTSHTWFGFSGGPVFRVERTPDGTCEWRLVGITAAGDKDRPTIKFISLIEGAAPLYNVVRDELALERRVPFPSTRFLDEVHSNPLSVREDATAAWVGDRLKDGPSGWTLTGQLLREDFLIPDARDQAPRIRTLFQHLMTTARKRLAPDELPALFSVLSQRSLSLIGDGRSATRQRMNAWREEARVRWDACARPDGDNARLRCWLTVIASEEFLWQRALEERFHAAVKDLDEGDGKERLVFWGDAWAEQLAEWGDALTKIALDNTDALPNAKAWFPPLFMIDRSRSLDPAEQDLSLRVNVNAAALDKFIAGVEGLQVFRKNLATLLPDVAAHRVRLCQEIRGTLERLQQLTSAERFPRYHTFLGNLRNDGVSGCPKWSSGAH